MLRRIPLVWPLFSLCLLQSSALNAQSLAGDVADLREETTLARQLCGDIQLSLETLEGKYAQQEQRLAALEGQLQSSRSDVLRLEKEVKARDEQLREALVSQESRLVSSVSERLQAFGKQTQRAIDKLAQDTQHPNQDTSLAQLHSQAGRVHVVGPGETLSSIARQYHISASLLQRVNDVKDPTRLQVGQDLFIPEPE